MTKGRQSSLLLQNRTGAYNSRKEDVPLDDNKQFIEIYERLGSIDAKIDDIRGMREVAYQADRKAEQSLAIAESNAQHVTRLENNFKWVFGLLASVLTPVAMIVFNFMIGK